MKPSANSLNQNSVEVLLAQGNQPQVNESAVLSGLKQVLHYLVKAFVGSNELRIWQTYDNFGNNRWHAFDPVTGSRTSLDSEAEMRVWIERHYYHSC